MRADRFRVFPEWEAGFNHSSCIQSFQIMHCATFKRSYIPVTVSITEIHEDTESSSEPDRNESIPAQSDPELPPITSALRLWLLVSDGICREHGEFV